MDKTRLGTYRKYGYFILLSVLAAIGNMGVVYLINKIISGYFSSTPSVSKLYFLYFLLSVALFFVCRFLVSAGIVDYTQMLLKQKRMEVLDLVLRSTYAGLKKRKEKVFSVLTRDADNAIYGSICLVDILTNVIVVIICFAYMGVLSWKLLLCILCLLSATITLYYFSEQRTRALYSRALHKNDKYIKYFSEVLDGFKEITMEPKKGRDISGKHIYEAIDSSAILYREAHIVYLNNRIIGQLAFYVFIGSMMFFLGSLFHVERSVVVNFIFLVLYVWGPIEVVVLLIQNVSLGKASLDRISGLSTELGECAREPDGYRPFTNFSDLTLNNLSYAHEQEAGTQVEDGGFGIRSIHFSLKPAEIVFIKGGNGSGKTTFIHMLTGIHPYHSGTITVNGKRVEQEEVRAYRSLFSPVFSDFHLFDESYGIVNVDAHRVAGYLQMMEIGHKVSFDGEKFSTINLSGGQRKRLALVSALMERKPIIVLDEFAADQDPAFKKKFYTEILPLLKSEGFAVVAVTHDEQYYDCADRSYIMDAGLLHRMDLTEKILTSYQ